MAIRLSQVASQRQIQKLSQVQIQAFRYLKMSSRDLRDEIYSLAQKNPAIEIVSENTDKVGQRVGRFTDNLRKGQASSAGLEKAQAFQEVLESQADTRESLQAHLLSQFNLIKMTPGQSELGTALIYNLDSNGYHILDPKTFLGPTGTKPQDLEFCLKTIQELEPAGVCCKNLEESLMIQALQRENVSPCSRFILDGHFDFLNPPEPSEILKKIRRFAKEHAQMSFAVKDYSYVLEFDIDDVRQTLAFIRTLEPLPARQYNSTPANYISPDIIVTRISIRDVEKSDETDRGFIVYPNADKTDVEDCFEVKVPSDAIPNIQLNTQMSELAASKSVSFNEREEFKRNVNEAKNFMAMLEQRRQIMNTAAIEIVRSQFDFFLKGGGNLNILHQKDIAKKIGVNESTVSRMANSKYVQCEWGLLPVSYFFTGGVNEVSSDKIKAAIQELLKDTQTGQKPMSDLKISKALEAKGMKVARRTVAKYRAQMDLQSSYRRGQ